MANIATYVTLQNGYTYSAAHQYFSSLATVVGTDQQCTTPTIVNGTFKCDNLTWTAVTGAQVTNFVIYRHNAGANTTWRLMAYFDTGVTGLPVTPNGGNISISWNVSGIYTLSSCIVKRDICQVGKVGPLPIFAYRYKWQANRRIGLIAEETEKLIPQAVKEIDGLKHVNYDLALSVVSQGVCNDHKNERFAVGGRFN